MKLLPHFEHAVIAIEKLENYVLISSVLWKTRALCLPWGCWLCRRATTSRHRKTG
jgi:hypothetical protein